MTNEPEWIEPEWIERLDKTFFPLREFQKKADASYTTATEAVIAERGEQMRLRLIGFIQDTIKEENEKAKAELLSKIEDYIKSYPDYEFRTEDILRTLSKYKAV